MFLLILDNLSAQTLTFKTAISAPLQETSGLLYLNGKLITHTDSGGEPALFEMDTTNGSQTRKVVIDNATNIDWEDITMDNDFIYIGDFGNNQGSRTNLRIYKISKTEYLTKDTVTADTIQFNYSDQIDFTPSNFTTNYDAEALISLGDSLYIFTKNWGNQKSYIYPISKQAGNYSLMKTDSINAQGYISGAVCDSARKQILLIGYTFNTAFFIKIKNWATNFSSGQITRRQIQPNSSIQIEGVAQIDSARYFISSEKFQSTGAELHVLDCMLNTAITNITSPKDIIIYPNPSDGIIFIKTNQNTESSVYSITGRLLLNTNQHIVNIKDFGPGSFYIHVKAGEQNQFQTLILH